MSGEIIQIGPDGRLEVPDHPITPFIEGDGVGPDIWRASQPVLDAAVAKAYAGRRRIVWLEVLAGEKAFRQTGTWLPQDTLEAFRKYKVGLKGPLGTPVGGGIRSLNVAIRMALDLYACLRPVKYIPGTPAPVREPHKVDMVVFRENTEDIYAGVEWPAGSPEAEKLIDFLKVELGASIRPGSGIGIKPISRFATQRLVRRAIRYALDHGRRSVTLVHKGNIMKYTEGAFKDWGYQTAREEFPDVIVAEADLNGPAPAGRVVIKDRIADAMFQQVLLRPDEYDVLAMPNLNGDYFSDALAAQVGGLGLAPGANIGDEAAVFEATHGTAPKYAGRDMINPGSLILSGAFLLEHLGWTEAAGLVRQGLGRAVGDQVVTYDLARQMPGARQVRTSEFGQAIVDRM